MFTIFYYDELRNLSHRDAVHPELQDHQEDEAGQPGPQQDLQQSEVSHPTTGWTARDLCA